MLHIVRIGAMGQVGRFTVADATRYPRGMRVIVRTSRGSELGQVLTHDKQNAGRPVVDGMILRGMTVEDELLQAKLSKDRQRAFQACRARLDELRLPVVLMDVEHLFDGQTLVFYFLGEQTPALSRLTSELAEAYEATVQFRRFTEAVNTGCGPGCGTDQAEGGGCGTSCSTTCAVAGACATRRA